MVQCSSCNASLGPSQILYSSDAKVICAACNAKVDLGDTDKRAARNIVRGATASLSLGVMSVVLLFFLTPIAGALPAYGAIAASIFSGVISLRGMAAGNERFTKLLSGGESTWVYIGSILGFVFCGFTLLCVLFVGAIAGL
jgi:hypothetical protein